jgi:hypothetical protein
MKGIAPLQGEIIAKQKNTLKSFLKKPSSPEPAGQIQSNLVQIILGWKEIKFIQISGQVLFKGEIILKNVKMGWGHLTIFFSRIAGPEKLKFTRKLSNILQNQVC